MNTIHIAVDNNEEKSYPFIWINGDDEEITLKAELIGDNSSLLICGLFLGTGDKKIIFNTEVTHKGRNTRSLTTIRGVFSKNANFSNDGMIRIVKGAKNTDGYFQSKILLFDDAKGRSVPSLEIDENEVKAGHGSTIGRPDEAQLFYLRSRGLSEKEAESLIISGFFDTIVLLLPQDEQKKIKKKIQEYLQDENI